MAALEIEPGTLTASSSPFVLAAQHLPRIAQNTATQVSPCRQFRQYRWIRFPLCERANTREPLSKRRRLRNIQYSSRVYVAWSYCFSTTLIIASCNVYLRKRHLANNTSYNFAYGKIYDGFVRARSSNNIRSKFSVGFQLLSSINKFRYYTLASLRKIEIIRQSESFITPFFVLRLYSQQGGFLTSRSYPV